MPDLNRRQDRRKMESDARRVGRERKKLFKLIFSTALFLENMGFPYQERLS